MVFKALAQKLSGGKSLSVESLSDAEQALLGAGFGVRLTSQITTLLSQSKDKSLEDALLTLFLEYLLPLERPLSFQPQTPPAVIVMAGINGVGKTTTLAKLAAYLKQHSLQVMAVAGDTFRAAAVQQLQSWGQKVGIEVISLDTSDPASVVFEGMKQGAQADVLLIDTAGRLHTKTHLMQEYERLIRVMKKQDVKAPHEIFLVLDAQSGQNVLRQIEVFAEAAPITGLIYTRLDQASKPGVVLSAAAQFPSLPIVFTGTGERIEDLKPFKAQEIAHLLTQSLIR